MFQRCDITLVVSSLRNKCDLPKVNDSTRRNLQRPGSGSQKLGSSISRHWRFRTLSGTRLFQNEKQIGKDVSSRIISKRTAVCLSTCVFRVIQQHQKELAIESVNLCNLSALVVSTKKSNLVGPPKCFPIWTSANCDVSTAQNIVVAPFQQSSENSHLRASHLALSTMSNVNVSKLLNPRSTKSP